MEYTINDRFSIKSRIKYVHWLTMHYIIGILILIEANLSSYNYYIIYNKFNFITLF